jgi:class 3 adenylate cyclase
MTPARIACAFCRADNRAGARFCAACGRSLASVCPRCASENDAGSRFCDRCGAELASPVSDLAPPSVNVPPHLAERILMSRAALEGERKHVTVLFADMKGSLELLAGRDPEDARRILDPMLEHMMEAVHHYEGTVNQVMGDGIMALFGAPIAHEDHAVRGCYAALRMQDSVRRYGEALRRAGDAPVQLRVGLNSGAVAVRSIGGDLRMDYTAVGQTTHLAARMEQLAAPGSILITADTLRLAGAYVRVAPLGRIPVAGLREPVESYELTGSGAVRTRLQAIAQRAGSAFVGREAEIEALGRALDAAAQGHGQIVAVVGEAGMGKSRLFYEFLHSPRVEGRLVLEAGSVSYGKASGYLPVIELLKSYFGIEERDDARRMRERITGKLLALDRSLEAALPALLALLEVPRDDDAAWQRLDPRQRRQAILDALEWLVLRECQVQPIVLVFEDLHWIDAESRAVLDALVECLPAARLLLLVNYRPEATHGWAQKSGYRQLRLDPLPRESAEALLDALLGTARELRDLRRRLIERTQGNPLFLEECVSTLAESGALEGRRGAYRPGRAIESIEVPPTVQAILAARIDRLPSEDKRLLQAAAVVGKDVPLALLRAIAALPDDVLRAMLARLQAAEFLYQAALFPDLEYTFRHALTHEVAYGSLLGERRRELHAKVLAAIETLHAERIGEHAERLAHHALRAGASEKAIGYLLEAGNKAVMRSGFAEAIGFFEEALGIVARLPESRATLAQGLALRTGVGPALMATKGSSAPEVQACYAQALELCDRLGETAGRFPVLFGLWYYEHSRGAYERARELAGELLRMAGEQAEPLQLEAHHAMWSTSIAMGHPADAAPHLRDGRRLYRPLERSPWWIFGTHDPGVCCHGVGAVAACLLGDIDAAREGSARSLQLANRLRHPFSSLLANLYAALVCYHCGERGPAKLYAQTATGIGHAHGFAQWPQNAALLLARLLIDEDRAAEAVAMTEANVPAATPSAWPWGLVLGLALAADTYARAAQPARGLELLRSMDEKCYLGLYGPELHRLYAELLLATAPAADAEAEARLHASLALARERRLKTLELRAAMSLARLLAPRDRRAARACLSVVDDFGAAAFEIADLRAAKTLREWLG